MSPPLVSCILLFADPFRINLARKAVNNFIHQHYVPYELIIVNGTSTQVLTNSDMDAEAVRNAGCHVREISVSAGYNAAVMKNIGLAHAQGEWVLCVDDDDYCHPTRVMYQMAHRKEIEPCLLQYQLRVDIAQALQGSRAEVGNMPIRPLLHLLKMDSGIPSTMLFPRVDLVTGLAWKFDETLTTGEYAELLARMQQEGRPGVVCNNMHNILHAKLDWPLLSVAVYHGLNTLTYEQFFARMDPLSDRNAVPVGLNQSDMEQLKVVLQSYNFRVQ